MDIERATELFYSVLNSFFNECVPDGLSRKAKQASLVYQCAAKT